MLRVRSRGQSTLEYVILIGFVVAALIAMGVYMKRGIQGKLRESTDQIGEQYSAGYTTGSYVTTSTLNQREDLDATGQSTTQIRVNTQNKTGGETVASMNVGY